MLLRMSQRVRGLSMRGVVLACFAFTIVAQPVAGHAEEATKRFDIKAQIGLVGLLALLSALLAGFRMPLCTLLFLHGAMDRAGVARIASVLPWALAGAAPFGALLVLARAHVARQNSRIMPGMGLLNSALNVAFNALFVGPLGLAGIALSTSMTYLVVAVVFWVRLPRAAHA